MLNDDRFDWLAWRPDEIDRLNAAVTELAAALNEAADDAEDYAQYLPGNLRTKWGVADDIARYRAIAAKHTTGDDQ